jgi:hypothetical protein
MSRAGCKEHDEHVCVCACDMCGCNLQKYWHAIAWVHVGGRCDVEQARAVPMHSLISTPSPPQSHTSDCPPTHIGCVGVMSSSCRWFVKRAGAIKNVHVKADWGPEQHGAPERDLLLSHLPFLAGCLCNHVSVLELTFDCELLSSAGS